MDKIVPSQLVELEICLTRQEAALQLGISVKTLQKYISIGSKYYPQLKQYLNVFGGLNRRKLVQSDVDVIKEIVDLFRRHTTSTNVLSVLKNRE